MSDQTVKNPFETTLSVNDVVQVQGTVADLEYVGLLGYVSKVSDSVIEVSFYYAKEKGQNAFVMTKEFLRPELYFVGTPNQDLLPC